MPVHIPDFLRQLIVRYLPTSVFINSFYSSRYFSKISILLLVQFFLIQSLIGQSFVEPSKLKQFNITVNFDNYTVRTQMLSQSKKMDVNNDRVYMWYTSQKIMETKGGYDGKLIHGTYRSFYLNNQLMEQGQVKYGLKHKEWKHWYPDGKLKEVITWKKGVKNGTYYLYNDYGQLMAKSHFKKDKLHGRFYTYGSNGKILEKKKYKRGDEILPKVKQQKQPRKKRIRTKKKTEKSEPDTEAGKEKKDPDKSKKTKLIDRLFKKKPKTEKINKKKNSEKKKESITS